MNILFICTSNKDRSPALLEYFSANYPKHYYKSAGINKYFTKKKATKYLTTSDLLWADLVVYAEDVHYSVARRDFNVGMSSMKYIILNLGEYKQGQVGEDYILRAEEKLKELL